MKFFKGTLAIVVLLAANSLFAARSTVTAAKKSAPVTKKAPVTKGKTTTKQAPAQAGQTYGQLVNMVKNSKTADVWDANKNLLKDDFVTLMIYEALGAGLDSLQLDALLQVARDYHATFWNIQKDNIDLLQNLAAQRQEAVNTFISKNLGGAL